MEKYLLHEIISNLDITDWAIDITRIKINLRCGKLLIIGISGGAIIKNDPHTDKIDLLDETHILIYERFKETFGETDNYLRYHKKYHDYLIKTVKDKNE